MSWTRDLGPCLATLTTGAAVAALTAAGCGGEKREPAPGTPRERAFLEAMVPHHESALEMADVAVRRGQDPEIERLARAIAAAQRPEIERMRSIHQRLFDSPLRPRPGAHAALGLSAEESGFGHSPARLRRVKPFDRAFIEEMVPHHEGAVRMARALLRAGSRDAELRRLAESIVRTQEREIDAMNGFIELRYGAPLPERRPAGGEEEQKPRERRAPFAPGDGHGGH